MKYYQGRLHPQDHKNLKIAAASKGISMETYCTNAILKALNKDGYGRAGAGQDTAGKALAN